MGERERALVGYNKKYRLFSTCPPSASGDIGAYLKQVWDVARWSEDAGCQGILIYTDNRLLDPWLLASRVIESTSEIAPLVAVQPVYMHPYTAAKMISSIAALTGRRVVLNMVAGGFVNDLRKLADTAEHGERYDRLVEYTSIVMRLLADEVVTLDGRYFTIDRLRLAPRLDPALMPEVFVSGSSAAGTAAAQATNATVVRYPGPADTDPGVLDEEGLAGGIRIGVIARETDEGAWSEAFGRFPPDREGQITHELAMRASDSEWHKQLSALASSDAGGYWLWPFQNYKTFCPYLVGSYGRVAEELARYVALGYETFILDVPAGAEELHHTRRAFDLAVGA